MNTPWPTLCACIAVVALAGHCYAQTAATGLSLFVAPNGSDANPGTQAKPFATLTKVRDALRDLKAKGGLPPGGVTVWIREGTYFLDKSFELTADDSGTEAAAIAYRAFGKEKVWLNGGKRVAPSHFKPVTDAAVLARLDEAARGKVVQLDIKAEGIPADVAELPAMFSGYTRNVPLFMELFCNGQRMQVARWPNEGFARFGEIVDRGTGVVDGKTATWPGQFLYEGDRPSRWRVDEGVWLWGYWRKAYYCTAVKVAAIDAQKRQIDLAVPMTGGLDTWGAKRFFAYNLLEELDTPGEWFLDRKRGILYFWPPSELSQADITISVLSTPLVAMQDASHVILRGLGIEGGRADAVSISGGSHNRVIGCTIRNIGRHAVVVTGGADHGVVGCDIHDIGHAGIQLSGGDRQTLAPANHFAVNNHIHHVSLIGRTHQGSLALRGVGCRAAHNLVHHDTHTAVWYNGNDHVMEFNEIYCVMTETSEGGVFYDGYDWTHRGNVIRHNYIHHVDDSLEGSPTAIKVVHLDDCVAGTDFVGNICRNVGYGVAMCGGPDNVVDNNIFVDCKVGAGLEDRGLKWWKWTRQPDGTVTAIDTRSGLPGCGLLDKLKKVPYNKPPYTKYPHLADLLDRDPVAAPWFCRITRNISVGGQMLSVARGIRKEWAIIENNWEGDDPGFVNLAAGDFRLKPDSPALKLGFEPIPFEKIGLIHDDTRASWPVVAEPPPKDWKPRWKAQREQGGRKLGELPVFVATRVPGRIVIDGVVDPKEWATGGAASVAGETYTTAAIEWEVHGRKATYPSQAWLECDAQHLYVAFVNEVDPARGVTGGQQWSKDDAVEIALAVAEKTVGPILILRGWPNGHFESSDEAGAPAALVQRAAQAVQYAAKVTSPGRWSAEWKIPFASLGLDPRAKDRKYLFNLSVRKTSPPEWVLLKKSRSYTWEVRDGAYLQLAP